MYSTVYEPEEEYPFHIVRYPDWDTVAPSQQFGGVLMGRYIACLEACTHMQDFKESVGNVARRALWRQYPVKLIFSVWARFLQKRWQAGDIRKKELVQWFRKLIPHDVDVFSIEPYRHRKSFRSNSKKSSAA